MKKRSLIAFLLALTMAFSLAACDNKTNDELTTNPDPGQTTEKTGYKVAYCTKRWSGSEHWMTVRNGVDGAIRPEDEYFFIDCNGDLDTQVKALEDLVAQGVDAIICAPRDPDGVVAAYEMIHNAGIKLISLDCSSSAPEFEDACVKMDYVSTGKLCAENLLEKIDYKGKVILYYDFPNVEANERADGFKEVAAQYPDVELVLVDGFGTVDEALLKLEDALIANPDAAAVWGYNSQVAQAAISLLESMQMDCLVSCVDCTSIEVENIRTGRLVGGAAQFPEAMGAKAVEVMYDILDGKTIEDKTIRLETEWVDASNVEEFAAKMGF